jgi:type IV fimbrial biogenesis protein FimT
MAGSDWHGVLGPQEGADVLKQLPVARSGSPHARRGRGFTLIELIVTITLLGILVGLALPSFTTAIHNSQVRTVAEALQDGLRTAQSESLRLNRPVVMAFTNSRTSPSTSAPWPVATNGLNWWLQTVPQFSDTADQAAGLRRQYLKGGSFADVAAGVTVTSGLNAICFNSNGRLAGGAAFATGVPGAACATPGITTFQVKQASTNSRQLNVIVTVGGQVRMCDFSRTLSATTPDGCPK